MNRSGLIAALVTAAIFKVSSATAQLLIDLDLMRLGTRFGIPSRGWLQGAVR